MNDDEFLDDLVRRCYGNPFRINLTRDEYYRLLNMLDFGHPGMNAYGEWEVSSFKPIDICMYATSAREILKRKVLNRLTS